MVTRRQFHCGNVLLRSYHSIEDLELLSSISSFSSEKNLTYRAMRKYICVPLERHYSRILFMFPFPYPLKFPLLFCFLSRFCICVLSSCNVSDERNSCRVRSTARFIGIAIQYRIERLGRVLITLTRYNVMAL